MCLFLLLCFHTFVKRLSFEILTIKQETKLPLLSVKAAQ